MTVIQIRGTSGSGKTTLSKAIMSRYTRKGQNFVEGRKQPITETWERQDCPRDLVTVGHSNTPCSGADTISGFDLIFDLVKTAHQQGNDVLFEGLLLAGDSRRIMELCSEIKDHLIISLTTPLEQCLANIGQRRALKGNTKPVAPANTASKFKSNQRDTVKLQEAGLNAHFLDYPAALAKVLQTLGV